MLKVYTCLALAFDALIYQHLIVIALAGDDVALGALSWWQGGNIEATRNWLNLLWWGVAVSKWVLVVLAALFLLGSIIGPEGEPRAKPR